MSEVEKLCDVIGIIHNGKLARRRHASRSFAKNTPSTISEEIFVKIVTPHYVAEEVT